MGQSEKQKRRALQQELTDQLAINAKLVERIEELTDQLRRFTENTPLGQGDVGETSDTRHVIDEVDDGS